MAAGYAFLLQLLLAGIAVTQMAVAATDDASIICSASDGNDTAQAAHLACAICRFAYPGLLRPMASVPAFWRES
jgi:hypothetical protein